MRRFIPALVLLTALLSLRTAAADNAVAPNPRVLWQQRQPPHYMAGSRGFMVSVPGVDRLVWTGATGDVLLASTTIAEWPANGFQDGLFASHDVGETWTRQGERIAGRSVHVFAAHPVTPTALLAGLSYTGNVSGTVDAGGMYQSVDSGVTWQSVLPDLHIQSIAHSPVDPQTVYAAAWKINPASPAASGVYKSSDGGATWVPISDRWFHDIAPHPSLPLVVFAAYRGSDNDGGEPGLYRSDDGGSTWAQLLADRVDSVVIDPRQPQRMFVLGLPYEKAWRTDDGGATWADLDDALGRQVLAVMPDLTSADGIWVGVTTDGVYYSPDAGRTYQSAALGMRSIDTGDRSGSSCFAFVVSGSGNLAAHCDGESYIAVELTEFMNLPFVGGAP